MEDKQYRNELKFLISKADAALLKKQLALVCDLDSHSVSSEYSYDIRSLYFDDVLSSAFHDKINGESYRKKYRIRMYNKSLKSLRLECKHKDLNYTQKQEEAIDVDTCIKLIAGLYPIEKAKEGSLIYQFLLDQKLFGLRPAVLVDYRRLAFTYPASELRITFDENIRSGRYNVNIFDFETQSFPVMNDNAVEIEIKCNDFIPDNIASILSSVDKCRLAISKYALAYGFK